MSKKKVEEFCKDTFFAEIYKQYQKKIFKFILGKIGVFDKAEELTDDVFYRCFCNIENFDETRCSIATWLYVIARNRLKNYYRDKKDIVSIDEYAKEETGAEVELERSVYLEEGRNILEKGFSVLSDREKELLILKYYNDLNSAEISRQTGIPSGTVRVMASRAIKKMQAYYIKHNITWEF